MSRAAHTTCDACGKSMKNAKRIYLGEAYCANCYGTTFRRVPCTQCDGMARAHFNDPNPVCRQCRNKNRVCLRCERPFTKAAKIIQGRPVCPRCARHFSPRKRCPNCGEQRRLLSRGNGFDIPVCQRCRNLDRLCCVRCKRYRQKAAETADGKSLCKDCLPGKEVNHRCPDCHQSIPGGGQGRCYACNLLRRIRRRIALNTELLETDWAQSLFQAFGDWTELRKEAPDLPTRLDRYARFFQQLETDFHRPDAITQTLLMEQYGLEKMRQMFMVVRFLNERCGLKLDPNAQATFVQEGRIQRKLDAVSSKTWYPMVEQYVNFLRQSGGSVTPGKTLAARTIITYLNAAIYFLRIHKPSKSTEISPEAIRRFAKRHPGYAASISRFAQYLNDEMGMLVHRPDPLHNRRARFEREMVKEIRAVLAELDQTDNPRAARALIARLISRLYQIPLETVLSLRWNEVEIRENQVGVLVNHERVWLNERVSGYFLRWMVSKTSDAYVFEARIPALPLNATAIYHHLHNALNKHG